MMFGIIGVIAAAGCGSGGSLTAGATGSATGSAANGATGGLATSAAATGQAAAPPSTTAPGAPPASFATSTGTAFSALAAQWNGSSFGFQGQRLTFKAVYTGVASASVAGNGGDCGASSKTVIIEQDQQDSLMTWPGCAEFISTPSDTYACELTAPVKCAAGDFPNPYSSYVGENLSAAGVLATLESASPQFLTSPESTYSNAAFAGQPARCVAYGATPSTSAKLCVTGSGLLAFLGDPPALVPSGASGSISLTSYSSSAPASDFAPPAGASMVPYAGSTATSTFTPPASS
jgi:hypothetical protein